MKKDKDLEKILKRFREIKNLPINEQKELIHSYLENDLNTISDNLKELTTKVSPKERKSIKSLIQQKIDEMINGYN